MQDMDKGLDPNPKAELVVGIPELLELDNPNQGNPDIRLKE